MAVVNLNKRCVEAAERETAPRHIHDKRTPGLILAVNKGRNSWRVKADLWRGRKKIKTVRHTLGTTDELDLDGARERAQEVLREIRRGVDPNASIGHNTPGVAAMTVGELWDKYEAWLRDQDRAERTISGFRRHLDKFLDDWRDTPVGDLRKSTCRERHERITKRNGKYPANHVLRSLRAAYNFALKLDDDDELRANPVGGVHFHPERRREAVILPEDLADWWRRTGALPSPLRTAMQRLGLLSGLRPGTLVNIERSWIDLPGQAIVIPRGSMKSRREFCLPLSGPMVGLVEDALRIGDTLYRESPWLFPTRTSDGREVVPTRVWRERSMPSETGHILRHTYRTMAERLGVPQSRARALLDHKQPGIEAHYVHSSALRDELLADQERMSAHILETAGAT
ncbi:MAG: integrase family protein [Proteobacteria bacterium]|nr:integrase family protein [Pseudomonadota bacterium]